MIEFFIDYLLFDLLLIQRNHPLLTTLCQGVLTILLFFGYIFSAHAIPALPVLAINDLVR